MDSPSFDARVGQSQIPPLLRPKSLRECNPRLLDSGAWCEADMGLACFTPEIRRAQRSLIKDGAQTQLPAPRSCQNEEGAPVDVGWRATREWLTFRSGEGEWQNRSRVVQTADRSDHRGAALQGGAKLPRIWIATPPCPRPVPCCNGE
jgi:hypothetical protein